ncbi:MAG: hypothetical protein COZ80_02135 [Ignavibacteria bacterium CG_4_8_14_3_um_filter_37_9]|nr:MAG: hypothetical protein COZ80_02135 [Ignavibacteria bacterium CG_4_8_14_3_um_filter_37_9]
MMDSASSCEKLTLDFNTTAIIPAINPIIILRKIIEVLLDGSWKIDGSNFLNSIKIFVLLLLFIENLNQVLSFHTLHC